MKEPPVDVAGPDLSRALREWGLEDAPLAYAPVGFGDHHWIAGSGDRRWFVTVADLRHKDRLADALGAAARLRSGGLEFVVAPLPPVLAPLGGHYGVSVYPYVDGVPGDWGDDLGAGEQGRILELLARLHHADPPGPTPLQRPQLPTRPLLDRALAELDRPWRAGPYGEPARELLTGAATGLGRRLAEFDRAVAALGERETVVTHGEPHPGNVLRAGERRLLVDWDTVGLAVPERDLWLVIGDSPDAAGPYVAAGGREPDPSALALYRLRWALNDVALFAADFRAPHTSTQDAAHAWTALTGTVAMLLG
ncbi:aminoglycoside phosphotransferase family protein [Streptosporangiaceae bacterium NEAU-GS5]|nr:aminoglycoside phosphotransferase family protein [Streptosporangiaceae bacterium NEAU-GS5]